jgi:hypothetical protein
LEVPQLNPPAMAFAVNCATSGLAIILALVLRLMLQRLNKKLYRSEHEGAIQGVPGEAVGKGFRYLV